VRIAELARRGVGQGADSSSFHEASKPAYSWNQGLNKSQFLEVAEPVPDGWSTGGLINIARELKVILMAGVIKTFNKGGVYNCYATRTFEGRQAGFIFGPALLKSKAV